ncbi:MAG: Ras GTPase activating protein ira2 [Thelocarpon superellum]|nr:MAG: Ras GTPase activating protein ira2 [Thelocarpon superellum]
MARPRDKLVTSLVGRLTSRLPYRTGIDASDLSRDGLFTLTRASLTQVSEFDIGPTIAGLGAVLDELSTKFGPIRSRPDFVLQSELYVVELLADCCTAHWNRVRLVADAGAASPSPPDDDRSTASPSSRSQSRSEAADGPDARAARNNHNVVPPALPEAQVMHMINLLTHIITPLPDEQLMPMSSLLDLGFLPGGGGNRIPDMAARGAAAPPSSRTHGRLDRAAFQIMEYLSASNWSLLFAYIQTKLKLLRALPVTSGPGSMPRPDGAPDSEASALAGLQLLAHVWIDRRKLSVLIQELCACFLNLQKPAQNAVAVLLPETIGRWIDTNPDEFVRLHTFERRLDGGCEFLFDMSGSMADDVRLKEFIWPFQTALVLLIPEVFWVAGSMQDAKGSLAKKAAFLEGLRQSLHSSRSSNTAAFCLVGICKVAHHFPLESDAALLSYALDVQLEVREEVFRPATAAAAANDDRAFDLPFMVAVIVSLCHLNQDSILDHLLPWCFQPDSPTQVKLAVFHSCAIMARQPDAAQYHALFAAVGPHVRTLLLARAAHLHAAHTRGRRPSADPNVDPQSYEVLCTMFDFLAIRPATLFADGPQDAIDYNEYFSDGLLAFVAYLADDDERVRSLASRIVCRIIAESHKIWTSRTRDSGSDRFLLHQWWRSTSLLLSTLAKKALDLSLRGPDAKALVHTIDDFLRARLDVLTLHKTMSLASDVGMDIPERSTASVDLEEAFLVLLCSSDLAVCAATRRALATCCEEGALTEDLHDLVRSPLSIMRNHDVYLDLSSPSFHLTGLVAFQKRYRRLLVKMSRPTPGMLTAWEFCFARWSLISAQILHPRAGARTDVDETALMEWRNYAGFLAALGGLCISDAPPAGPRPDGAAVDAPFHGIDQAPADGEDASLLDRFTRQCLLLLSAPNVRAREAIRDVLGTELSPRLYAPVFRALEAQMTHMFEDDDASDISTEARLVFAEQVASLLRAIFERLDDVHEALVSADFGVLALDLAQFLDGLPTDLTTLRVKIKICQLCEAVTGKREALKIGHDIRVRNQLLALLLSWMSRPGAPRADETTLPPGVRPDAVARVQRDLDRTSLRALVDLTFGLPLQPPEGQSDADTSESKSALYHDYFGRFLSLLDPEAPALGNPDDAASIGDLVITALSNLLSANIDVGLKQTLEIGYHPDRHVRTAFLRVLCNILNQEVEFERLSDAAMSEKYKSLLELFLNDLGLCVALCEACPSSEVDEITYSLLNVFESRGRGLVLLKALIEHEVAITENETELLRRNSVTTKMLSAYGRWKGAKYLRVTLQQLIRRLLQAANELDLELDPVKVATTEQLQRNAVQLCYVSKIFIDEILKSTERVPVIFRRICNLITTAVAARFPEAIYTAVGAFVFLRFFCPAIVAPESEGLVSTVPTKEMRRGLLLIAKVVQNLANNVPFGVKEAYMFPLNDFLSQHIIRVTAFLREISAPVPASTAETEPWPEAYDFGSCVALHRFLFEHWDTVRQKVVMRERRSWQASTSASSASTTTTTTTTTGTTTTTTSAHEEPVPAVPRTSAADVLGGLVAHLGSPSVDISWNRPLIAANIPPTYSRFQHFMLKNAGRNSEAVISARAVYDGGHTKEGLPVICIILSSIEAEGIDHDLLLYCYLKIASRMWHRPFAVLVDATCYNSLSESQDDLFHKLDALSPAELTRHLSKVYVYNMNSAFRKCFRRALRLSGKHEHSSFHPSHVEYRLIGSLQELQGHFHLGPLHLPKTTIAVVNDSRFVFQPVVRLSKTKGKIDVVIKIGSQFVQITTTKKQDIAPGLRLNATVNDIFRLADVDEASGPGLGGDGGGLGSGEHGFGLRTENGKIVMHFNSARKSEILGAIRSAKAKHSKNAKPTKSSERLIRPEDVPGTLLNIALMNLASDDHALRRTSYNLLCSLCRAFHFGLADQFVAAQDLYIPASSVSIVVGISERLAGSEPHLTSDFLGEFFLAWERLAIPQRSLHVLYMVPWLGNLRTHVLAPDREGEKGKERVAWIARRLMEVVLDEPGLSACLQRTVWPVVARDELVLDILLDEMIKMALAAGAESERTDAIGAIAAALGTVTVQGKVIARLRKILNRSSLRPTRHLPGNAVWSETCVLLHLCVATSFASKAQSQLFLPELFHIITSVVNTGSVGTRSLVHNLLVNTVHAIGTSFPLDEARRGKLKLALARLSQPSTKMLFTLHPAAVAAAAAAAAAAADDSASGESGGVGVTVTAQQERDNANFTALQSIVQLMLDVIGSGAPSTNIANMWRARWMSLVASTAFQSNPAIQPRAFAVMGCLAREEVDDDLLYQVLVSLRTAMEGYGDEADAELLIAIVTTLTKMMTKLSSSSRYLVQLFWLAMSLVRLASLALFDSAASFLEAVLQAIAASGDFKHGQLARVLLQARQGIDEVTREIDALYGVHFREDNFHFACCACLIKGLADPVSKDTTLRTITSFLEIASASVAEERHYPKDKAILPYHALVASRATTVDEIREMYWLTGLSPDLGVKSPNDVFAMLELQHITDAELALHVALSIVDFASCEDAVQQRSLVFLQRVATQRPPVLVQIYEPVASVLDGILQSSETVETLEAAHALMRSLAADSRFIDASRSTRKMSDVLGEVGMSGIWKTSTFRATQNHQRRCAVLVGKLIELIII